MDFRLAAKENWMALDAPLDAMGTVDGSHFRKKKTPQKSKKKTNEKASFRLNIGDERQFAIFVVSRRPLSLLLPPILSGRKTR